MSVLVWDKVDDRLYDTGLDRGVLYLSDGSAVPWNGLTSVVEKFDKDTDSIYYDGIKISDSVSLGDFAATMKALTYPEEFVAIEGYGFLRKGIAIGDQIPQTFSLSYRTQVGNNGNVIGHKIHILYNLTAIPTDRTHSTLNESSDVVEFEWDISSIPEEIPGFRPTAHIILNTLELEPALLTYIEEKLYGSEEVEADLIRINDLISYMYTWVRIEIVDNSDGSWAANCLFDDLSFDVSDTDLFTIINTNVRYLDADTYEISDTINTSDIT